MTSAEDDDLEIQSLDSSTPPVSENDEEYSDHVEEFKFVPATIDGPSPTKPDKRADKDDDVPIQPQKEDFQNLLGLSEPSDKDYENIDDVDDLVDDMAAQATTAPTVDSKGQARDFHGNVIQDAEEVSLGEDSDEAEEFEEYHDAMEDATENEWHQEPVEDLMTPEEEAEALLLPKYRDEPADTKDWDKIVVARMAPWGEGEPMCALQALIQQTKDGSECGSAHGCVQKEQMKSISDSWIVIHQPNGYITKLTGFHSKKGVGCLLHSLRMEFASGQVIQVKGTKDEWKGDAFIAEHFPKKFYLSALEFQQGMCVGYRGYSTDVPVEDIMAEEEEPDIEKLQAIADDANRFEESDTEEGEGDGDNTKKENKNDEDDNNEKKNAEKTDKDDPNSPNYDPGGWADSSLPAKELPIPDNREEYMVAYVCLCGGAALQGAIMYYYDHKRQGYLLNDRLKNIDIHQDVEKHAGIFVPVEQPGGRIVRISGHHLAPDAAPYLCHSLKLEFGSGQVIEFEGYENDYEGKYFSYDIPTDFYLNQLYFQDGKLSGVAGVRTNIDDSDGLDPPGIENRGKNSCRPCCCCCLPT
jgi:hypothetical protein